MADPIHEYLNRLKSRLSKRLPSSAVDEQIREIENHLTENMAGRMACGEDERTASVHALGDVGSDYLVADSLIRAHSGIAKRSVWRLAWIPSVLLLISAVMPFTYQTGLHTGIQNVIEHWAPWCFLLAFSVACLRSRRIILKPVFVCVAVVFVLLFSDSCFFGPFGITPIAVARRQVMIRQMHDQVDELSAALTMVHAGPSTPFPAILKKGDAFMTPAASPQVANIRQFSSPITRQIEFPAYTLLPKSKEAEARAAWRNLTVDRIWLIENNLKTGKENLSAWETMEPGWPSVLGIAGRMFLVSVTVAAFLAAMNLVALALFEIRRRVVMAAWRRRRSA